MKFSLMRALNISSLRSLLLAGLGRFFLTLLMIVITPELLAVSTDEKVIITWDEKFYNPKPLDDDVIFPLPCEGAIVFRRIAIPLDKPLEDYSIVLGREDNELGFVEYRRQEYIAGSFSDETSKLNPHRYYLIAKYELTELQYLAITNKECPKPSQKLLLPKTQLSWMEAMNVADLLNVWLRKNSVSALPKEDGQLGFLRLPTETEWEFAARGGLNVSLAEFRDTVPPMEGGENESIWFAGPKSSNGQLQLVGRLKANPLGLHDMLGNVEEMMFEPFRMNKLDRQHGQAGGYIIRGGSYLTPLSEIRSSSRNESPYYDATGAYKSKTQGIRFVMVAPAITSTDQVKRIENAWQALGNQSTGGEKTVEEATILPTTLDSLAKITNQLEDVKIKQELELLRNQLRAQAQARDEQRDGAVRSSLQLGAFLCTKVKDDGLFYERLAEIYEKSCPNNESTPQCEKRKIQLKEHQQVLDFLISYYADTLVGMSTNYHFNEVAPQIDIVRQQMLATKKSNLDQYLQTYWNDLQDYWNKGQIQKEGWLTGCVQTAE